MGCDCVNHHVSLYMRIKEILLIRGGLLLRVVCTCVCLMNHKTA